MGVDHLDEILNIQLSQEQRRILARLDEWKVTLLMAGISETEALTVMAGVKSDVLAPAEELAA